MQGASLARSLVQCPGPGQVGWQRTERTFRLFQAKVDSVTPRWVLISACEARLAAKNRHCSHSTYFRGSGKWKCCGGVSGETMR